MRTELVLSSDENGHITQVGWTVRDSTGELVALGCHLFGDVTNFSRIEALAIGLLHADKDVEMNGVAVPLPF